MYLRTGSQPVRWLLSGHISFGIAFCGFNLRRPVRSAPHQVATTLCVRVKSRDSHGLRYQHQTNLVDHEAYREHRCLRLPDHYLCYDTFDPIQPLTRSEGYSHCTAHQHCFKTSNTAQATSLQSCYQRADNSRLATVIYKTSRAIV